MNIRELSNHYIECFSAIHEEYGYESAEPVKVSSRADASVYLIGSTISVLKPYLLTTENRIKKKYLIQPAIRTQQLKHMEKLEDSGSCYGSFFIAMGDLAPYTSLEETFELTMKFLRKIFGIDGQNVMFRVSSKDADLLKCCTAYEACSKIEVDSRAETYYQHHYGLDQEQIFGRNCNIAVAPKGSVEYRDVANIIVIEREGHPFAVELAVGISTLLSHALGLAHTMQGNLIADSLKMSNIYEYWLGDCVSVITCLESEGVYPNSSKMSGRILKRYQKVLDVLCAQLGYDEGKKRTLLSDCKKEYIDFIENL